MKILIDESLPRYLKRALHEHDASTVQEMSWSGIKNGVLLARAEEQFDVFLTADKNLRYQQNLKERALAIIVFPSNRLSVVKQLDAQLHAALTTIAQNEVIEL
jgi:predicted nuclease of predicted toxin-antitoxin system